MSVAKKSGKTGKIAERNGTTQERFTGRRPARKPAGPPPAATGAPPLSSEASERSRAERLERLVAGFGTAVVVGLALVGIGPSTLGALLTLVGLVGLGASTHAFGRLGPDESFDPRRGAEGAPGR